MHVPQTKMLCKAISEGPLTAAYHVFAVIQNIKLKLPWPCCDRTNNNNPGYNTQGLNAASTVRTKWWWKCVLTFWRFILIILCFKGIMEKVASESWRLLIRMAALSYYRRGCRYKSTRSQAKFLVREHRGTIRAPVSHHRHKKSLSKLRFMG